MKIEINDIYGALACWNGDAYIVENEEQVNEILEAINGGIRLVSEGEEREEAMSKLDLTKENNIESIYFIGSSNTEGTYVCFSKDWN